MQDLVSAIITTYKRGPETVVRAVTSIIRQTYPNIEIIVVDDSPDTYELRDEVEKAVKAVAPDAVYLRNRENAGACVSRNNGVAAARGEYVAFLDDDDEWLPEKIEKQLNMLTREQAAMVYCLYSTSNDDGDPKKPERVKCPSGNIYEELIWENFIGSTSFPLIRKSCLTEIGGFDPLMKSAQDYDVWLRLARRYPICCLNESLGIYHSYQGERISNNAQKRIDGQLRLIEKNRDYLESHTKAWWRRHMRLTKEYGKNKQLGEAVGLWWRCVRKCPEKFGENAYYFALLLKYYMDALKNG